MNLTILQNALLERPMGIVLHIKKNVRNVIDWAGNLEIPFYCDQGYGCKEISKYSQGIGIKNIALEET